MSATVTFEPLPDVQHQFEPTSIDLHGRDQIYVIGFPRLSLVPSFDSTSSLLDSPSASEYDSDSTRGSGSGFSRRSAKRTSNKVSSSSSSSKAKGGIAVSELGFSDELVGDKLCIVPADPDIPLKMRVVYAAIWLAPGYKVMILPSEGTKIYYQRAIPGNQMWRRINHGYGVDLADPFMTVLDNGIHIKIDTRPNKHAHNRQGKELLRRVLRYLRRTASASASSTSTSYHSVSRCSTLPAYPHPLVRQVHTEIDGTEKHDGVRSYQIAACVRVNWLAGPGENMRAAPEKGLLTALRKEREEKWRGMEKEEREEREKMACKAGATDGKKAPTGTTSTDTSQPPAQETGRGRARDRALPAIPETEHELEQEIDETPEASPSDAASRPSRPQRTKSNTTKLSTRTREPSHERSSSPKSQESRESSSRSSDRHKGRSSSPRR